MHVPGGGGGRGREKGRRRERESVTVRERKRKMVFRGLGVRKSSKQMQTTTETPLLGSTPDR